MKIIRLNTGHEIIVDDDDFERVSAFNWYVQRVPGHIKKVFRWIDKKDGWHGKRIWLHNFILNSYGKPIGNKNQVWNDYRKENLNIIEKSMMYKRDERILTNENKRNHALKQMMYRRLFDPKHCLDTHNYRTNKIKTNTQYKIKQLTKSRIWAALRSQRLIKNGRTVQSIGCSISEFMFYLEKQFREGMSWENHGEIWEIDHIKPCVSFNLSDPIQLLKCFNYTNCQPLYKQDNRCKSDRIDGVSLRRLRCA